jgi:trehalose 6-phosphate phosphatase
MHPPPPQDKEKGLKLDAKSLIDSFLEAVGRAPQSLLMLDYDGTIAPFRKNRDQAFPYPGFSLLLQEIVCTGRTRVVIISGRDANELVPLLEVEPRPEIWGLHGLQRLNPDGSIEISPLDESTTEALSAAEIWLHYQQLQHTAEFKTGSIAVHWRGLGECEAEALRGRVLLGWKPIARQRHLHVMEFDGGLEIRARDADKGDAVRTILSEMTPDTPAAFLGDDTTDEHAFEAMNGRGLSVLVRPRCRATAAQVWLKPPYEVFDLLAQWLHACQGHNRSSSENALEVNV